MNNLYMVPSLKLWIKRFLQLRFWLCVTLDDMFWQACLSALIVMTILSAADGWAAPNLADDDAKKNRPLFSQFFSPIFLKAFSITFFGEWGDKSQIATIGLAAAENPLGVVLGGILEQALCQTTAVFRGKSLATQISENFIALSDGVLFIVFGIQSFATVES